jgi:hypothetical protein
MQPEDEPDKFNQLTQNAGVYSYLWLSTVSTALSTAMCAVDNSSVQPLSHDRAGTVDNSRVPAHAGRQPIGCLSECLGGLTTRDYALPNLAASYNVSTTPRHRNGAPRDVANPQVSTLLGPRTAVDCSSRSPAAMIANAIVVVTHLTATYRCGEVTMQFERRSMATHSFGPGPATSSGSISGSPAWNHTYAVAAIRAGLIALALLAVLLLIVLS